MRTVDDGADTIGETKFDALPERVQEALGELAGAAKEGLHALSVGVGLGVLTERRPEDVVAWLAQQMAKKPIAGMLRIAWDSTAR